MAVKKFRITLNGVVHEVEVEEISSSQSETAAKAAPVQRPAQQAAPSTPAAPKQEVFAGDKSVTAPMPGKVLSIKVKEGDNIKAGDVLLILEAMKMQNEITATADGKVTSVAVAEGSNVTTGDLMIGIE